MENTHAAALSEAPCVSGRSRDDGEKWPVQRRGVRARDDRGEVGGSGVERAQRGE